MSGFCSVKRRWLNLRSNLIALLLCKGTPDKYHCMKSTDLLDRSHAVAGTFLKSIEVERLGATDLNDGLCACVKEQCPLGGEGFADSL